MIITKIFMQSAHPGSLSWPWLTGSMTQDWVFTAAAGLVAAPAFIYSIRRTPTEESGSGGDDGSQKTFGMARVGGTPLLDWEIGSHS